MTEQILAIIENEIVSLLLLGIGGGFMIGTIFYIIAFGIFKALYLVNIIKR